MCGIIGIVGKQAVTPSIYDALTILQHRGQDAAGIATLGEGHRIHLYKGNGLVKDVFPRSDLLAQENLRRYVAGEAMLSVVDIERGY